MDKRLMHYEFPRDQIQLEGTMVELPGKVAAVVEDATDTAIVAAILAAARAEEVTDLYLIDKTFILDAIREKLEREKPKPLTIEELRQMDGEPVWVTVPEEPAVSAYCTIDVCTRFKEDRGNDKYSEAMVPGDGFSYYQFDKYGKTWIAYRHRPKEEHHGK